MSWLWLSDTPYLQRHYIPNTYHECMLFLCKLIGMKLNCRVDEDYVEMLKNSGWRQFTIERYTRAC